MNAATVVVALHYQNDVLHPEGRIRVGLAEGDPVRERVLDAAQRLLAGARQRALPIIHVRIAFRPDYADLARNTPIFRRTAEIGAVRDGEWGAEFHAALAPRVEAGEGGPEFVVKHTRISAFFGTQLEELLRLLDARRVVVAGVATHSVVESTVRDAADRGYQVMVATDACAAADPAVHAASIASMSLIAETAPVATVLQRIDEEGEAA